MPAAQSLADLVHLRSINRSLIEGHPDVLGSALGFDGHGAPAVHLHVDRKVHRDWIPEGRLLPRVLRDPRGTLHAPVEVIELREAEDPYVEGHWYDHDETFALPLAQLEALEPLSPPNRELLQLLRGWGDVVPLGGQIVAEEEGTLTCFARRDGKPGFLSNQHILGAANQTVQFPARGMRNVGTVRVVLGEIPAQDRLGALADARTPDFVGDLGWAELHADTSIAELDPRLRLLKADGTAEARPVGPPMPMDLQSMGAVGELVVSVGRTRGFQRGRVEAALYEGPVVDGEVRSVDYLIRGLGDDEFSQPGDSGKLIVTERGLRPVAVLWGGRWTEMGPTGPVDWTFATDIGQALDRLGVTLGL